MSDWYTLKQVEVLERLDTDEERGLSEEDSARRLKEYGPNELIEQGLKSPWLIFWEQLTATVMLILIIAAIVSIVLGDYKDAAVILIIVVLNALLGFHQEYRAEKAMAALKKLSVPTVKVRRDGHVREISARELVPGDIVLLEAGNLVPADCRVLQSANLRIQEAALTGESEPVEKDPEALPGEDSALGDRRDMAYMGTTVTYGHGQCAVTETGMSTELGRIADLIQTVEREPTPLQKRLNQLGRGLAAAALVIVAVIFVLGVLRGEDVKLMLMTAMSIAVAAVPEGLPAVVTIALALGAQRMLKRHALIRKLPAVETLGSVGVICSDKTGTLTENRMTVTILDVAGCRVDLNEELLISGYGSKSEEEPEMLSPALTLLLSGGALCNDALLDTELDAPGPNAEDEFHALGDPTEGALVIAAARLGLRKDDLDRKYPRVAEVPFDSKRKRMTTVHKTSGLDYLKASSHDTNWDLAFGEAPYVAFTKGAVDGLLDVSDAVWVNGHAESLDEDWRKRISESNDRLAEEGMRVLGVAFKPLKRRPYHGLESDAERNVTFIGMMGMIDPPRPEVKAAVETCRAAGIRPLMITGDHPLTARKIARELGISDGERVITGRDLERLSDGDLEGIVEEETVYARVSPEHKLNIVRALQNRNQVVAMTGDGVNDAPALRRADIGVAMGITGTDVSKEAADMVLLDDNFATIVAAVEEGRVIYDNIRKFVKYTMTSNSGEIWVMLLAPFFGMPLALLPLQILWINLLTDGLPGLALTVESAERGTMQRRPYGPDESIFGRGMARHIILIGLLMGLVPLGVGYWYWSASQSNWQTMVFTTLTLSQMGHALAIRSGRDSLFTVGLFSNKPLIGAVLVTFALQLAVVYLPFLQSIFRTEALSAADFALGLLVSSVVFLAVEIEKWFKRRKGPSRDQGSTVSYRAED